MRILSFRIQVIIPANLVMLIAKHVLGLISLAAHLVKQEGSIQSAMGLVPRVVLKDNITIRRLKLVKIVMQFVNHVWTQLNVNLVILGYSY